MQDPENISGVFIAIDFDGTMVEHEYPEIGVPIPDAVEVVLELIAQGHQILLNTMRGDDYLDDAVKWCEAKGITLFGANHNSTQSAWTGSTKTYAHYYIDDAAIGTKLKQRTILGRPSVDWAWVRAELVKLSLLPVKPCW